LLEVIEDGVAADAITSVEVRVPPPYLRMIDHGVKAGDRASYLTSVQYNLALAACDRSGLYDVQHSPGQLMGDVQAFMQKVSVVADQALLSQYPKAWPARVVVHARTGTHERLLLHVPGDPQRPFDDQQIVDKFRRILPPGAGASAEGLLRRCRAIFDNGSSSAGLLQEITRASG
jgi:2-methylcitrate dehydratase PrpD